MLILLAASLTIASFRNPYFRVVGGCSVMLIAFVGWGIVVERFVLKAATPFHWGLRAAWGMTATLAIGGFAAALHLAGPAAFVTQLTIGCLVFVVSFVTTRRAFISNRRITHALATPGPLLVLAIGIFLVAFQAFGAAATTYAQPSDDPALYWPFAEDFLRTGTLFEPFCFRRVTTYGGQSYLHAMALLYSRHDQLFALDGGVGFAVLFGIVTGEAKRRRRSYFTRLAIGLVLLFSLGNVVQNVASLMTGAAATYALYLTMASTAPRAEPGRLPIRHAALLGALVGATVVLRTSNAIASCAFVAIAVFVCRAGIQRRWTLGDGIGCLRDGVVCAGAFVIFMVPWAAMFHASIGTYVYPLSRGNLTPGFKLLERSHGFLINMKALVGNLAMDRPITALLPFFIAGILLGTRRGGARAVVPAAVVCSLVGFVTMVVAGGGFDSDVMARYYFAYTVATVFLVIGFVDLAPRRIDVAGVLVVFATFVHAVLRREDSKRRYTESIEDINRAEGRAHDEEDAQEELTRRYRAIQSFVPRGERAVTAVAEPFRFDLSRNDLKLLDQPGGLGPAPGFPVNAGPQAIARYFRDNGYRYMITIDFHGGHQLYDINHWRGFIHPATTHKPGDKLESESYLSLEAPFQVAATESLAVLRKQHVLYEDLGMTVVDLAAQ